MAEIKSQLHKELDQIMTALEAIDKLIHQSVYLGPTHEQGKTLVPAKRTLMDMKRHAMRLTCNFKCACGHTPDEHAIEKGHSHYSPQAHGPCGCVLSKEQAYIKVVRFVTIFGGDCPDCGHRLGNGHCDPCQYNYQDRHYTKWLLANEIDEIPF